MTFEEAISNASRTLNAAETQESVDRAEVLVSTASTWVRVAELIHDRGIGTPTPAQP